MSALLKTRIGIAAACSCLFAGYVVAQQQTVRERESGAIEQPSAQNPGLNQTQDQLDRAATPGREYTANFRGETARSGSQDESVQRYVAGCLLAKNQAEIEMAKFAQQQAQTPEVKEFAQKMVQDHGKMVQNLQTVSSAKSSDRNLTTDPPQSRSELNPSGQNAADTAAATASGSNNAIDQLLALDRQIVERCTQAAREELQQKQGVEFDKCYIGAQINGHMQTLAALEVIQQQGPKQLQQIAQQAQPTVQQHLDHAKQIMKQLEGDTGASSRAARQPTRTQR